MTGLPAPLLISVLCTRMGFSDVSGPFCLDDGFFAAASSNIEIGGARGRLQWHSSFLCIDRWISVKDCRAVFGSASCWKNGSVRVRPFCFMSGNLFFSDKGKLFLDNKVLGGLDTGEASRFVTSFFEVAGYNCGQMRAQKWFRLTDPILAPSLYLGTEIGSAGRTLNRPLQKARFTFQAGGIRLACVDGPVNSVGQGDACIVAVARLVSLWRDI